MRSFEVAQRLTCFSLAHDTQIKLDLAKISALQLSVTTSTVAHAILNTPKLKLKPIHVQACLLAGEWVVLDFCLTVFSPRLPRVDQERTNHSRAAT